MLSSQPGSKDKFKICQSKIKDPRLRTSCKLLCRIALEVTRDETVAFANVYDSNNTPDEQSTIKDFYILEYSA